MRFEARKEEKGRKRRKKIPSKPNSYRTWSPWRGPCKVSKVVVECRIWPLKVLHVLTPPTHWYLSTCHLFFLIIFIFIKKLNCPLFELLITKKQNWKYKKKPLYISLVIFESKGKTIILMFFKKKNTNKLLIIIMCLKNCSCS